MKRLTITLAALAAAQISAPGAVRAQASDTITVYEREVFTYQRAGRPDPFRSLLNSADLGFRFEDLTLHGIIYHPDARRSVAVLSHTGSARRIQARVGERVGGLMIAAIRPRAVDVVIEEFGVARRETMELNTVQGKGGIE